MPIRMQIRLTGDDVPGMLGILRRELEPRRRKAMFSSLSLLKTAAQSRIYSPEGRARRGIGYRVSGAGEALRGILASRNTAAIFSQRSRAAGTKMPPVKAIARWLKRTGQEATRSSAFLIARQVARRGVRGRPIMADTLRAKREEVIALFKQILVLKR